MEGSLCPKGQAGIQALYDPYRLVKVLKRAGKRGENKWKTIPFEQAVTEIVNGGNLFGEGEVDRPERHLRAQGPQDCQGVGGGRRPGDGQKNGPGGLQGQARRQFEIPHRSGPPGSGPQEQPVRLQFGPTQSGAGDMLKRFIQGALGTENQHGHTTVCQGSLYFTCKAMSYQFVEGNGAAPKSFTGRRTPATPSSFCLWAPTPMRPITARRSGPKRSPAASLTAG
jgi:tetrathionate reductase subunit A